MAENLWKKYREDREQNLSKGPKHRKQANQKRKPYVVLEYLMKYSDESNTKSAYDIIGYLEGCGISAERRSIYRDIEDTNRIKPARKRKCPLPCFFAKKIQGRKRAVWASFRVRPPGRGQSLQPYEIFMNCSQKGGSFQWSVI